MSKVVSLFVALIATLCIAQDTIITSETAFGMDFILIDTPSFPTSLWHSYSLEEVYVLGQDAIRVAHTADDFALEVETGQYNIPYVSAYPFYNGTNYNALFVAGIVSTSQYVAGNPVGYTTTITLEIPNQDGTKGAFVPTTFQNFNFFNLWVDYTDPTDILAYLVGFRLNTSNSETDFVVVRAHMRGMLINGLFSKKFTFDPELDVSPVLYSNQYTPYSQTFKPFIDCHEAAGELIIVDPNTGYLYKLGIADRAANMTLLPSDKIIPAYTPLNDNLTVITSFALGHYYNKTYVGYAGQGINGGGIAVFDNPTGNVKAIQLPEFQSNPRALMLDEMEGALYVGFKGLQPDTYSGAPLSASGLIMKLDMNTLETVAQQNIPFFAANIESGRVGGEHVYFVTHDQHAILGRVNKADFCVNQCPSLPGYCSNGACVCGQGFYLSGVANSQQCLTETSSQEACNEKAYEQSKEIKSEHGAVAALAVFFVLSFLAAIAGWGMWYRARYGAYRSM